MRLTESRAFKVARVVLPALAGAALGYLYWSEVGCVTGGCPLTSNPWVTTGLGGLVGLNIGWPSRRPASPSPTRPTEEEG